MGYVLPLAARAQIDDGLQVWYRPSKLLTASSWSFSQRAAVRPLWRGENMRGHIAVPVLLVALLAVLLGAAAPTTVTPRDDAQPAPTATGTPGPPPIPRFPTR